jgi:hypothetical protein
MINNENDNIIIQDPIEHKQALENEADMERIDEWTKCWVDKKFPHNTTYEDYSEWRKFRDFWFNVYPELPLKVAHTIYLLKQKEKII